MDRTRSNQNRSLSEEDIPWCIQSWSILIELNVEDLQTRIYELTLRVILVFMRLHSFVSFRDDVMRAYSVNHIQSMMASRLLQVFPRFGTTHLRRSPSESLKSPRSLFHHKNCCKTIIQRKTKNRQIRFFETYWRLATITKTLLVIVRLNG